MRSFPDRSNRFRPSVHRASPTGSPLPWRADHHRRRARTLLLAVGAMALLSSPVAIGDASAQSARGGGFAALVNGKPITNFELEQAVERRILQLRSRVSMQELEAAREEIRGVVLDELITERLLLARCDAESIEVRPEQVDLEIQRLIDQARADGDGSIRDATDFFDQWEAEYGQNEELARRDIRKQIRIRMLVGTIYEEEYIPPAELRAYYRNHHEEFATPAMHSFRQILLPLSDPACEEKLRAIRAALDEDTPFEDLVSEYSQGPRREFGGLWEMTEQQLGGMILPIPEVVRTTPAGEVAAPIATAANIHLIQVVEHRVGKRLAFEECQGQIRSRLRQLRQQQAQEKFQRDLRRDAEIRVMPREPAGVSPLAPNRS